MLKKPKFIPKSTLVIIALVVLNIIVFLAVSSGINISHKHRTTDNIITNADDNNYFKEAGLGSPLCSPYWPVLSAQAVAPVGSWGIHFMP